MLEAMRYKFPLQNQFMEPKVEEKEVQRMLTDEEKDELRKQRIAEIERMEAKNFPKVNYKWY